MKLSIRHLPAYVAAYSIGILLFVFIALPAGLVLVESVRLSGAMPLQDLASLTNTALNKLDPEDRDRQIARWIASLKTEERTTATAAALGLSGGSCHGNAVRRSMSRRRLQN